MSGDVFIVKGKLLSFFIVTSMFLCSVFVSLIPVYAEKEEAYTSSEEFLPLSSVPEQESIKNGILKLQSGGFITEGKIKSIKILKEKKEIVFTVDVPDFQSGVNLSLYYELESVNFPPRLILRLYGVKTSEKIFKFFKNTEMDITGVVQNPFDNKYYVEYVIFFRDWINATSWYNLTEKKLTVEYEFENPPYQKGYGVRIADTKIDPLPQVVEIRNKLLEHSFSCYLLMATDYSTVVLESPFYETKDEAVMYMENLSAFGYNGKLAIRNYLEFPKPHRFQVVSEVVITEDSEVNLKNFVYAEFYPEKLVEKKWHEIFTITKDTFSPRIQSDPHLLAYYYYTLSDMYRNYNTEDQEVYNSALLVAVKMLEIVYFIFRDSDQADDALWEIANMSREFGIVDVLSEKECYQKIVDEYPDSVYSEEAKVRLGYIIPGGYGNKKR